MNTIKVKNKAKTIIDQNSQLRVDNIAKKVYILTTNINYNNEKVSTEISFQAIKELYNIINHKNLI